MGETNTDPRPEGNRPDPARVLQQFRAVRDAAVELAGKPTRLHQAQLWVWDEALGSGPASACFYLHRAIAAEALLDVCVAVPYMIGLESPHLKACSVLWGSGEDLAMFTEKIARPAIHCLLQPFGRAQQGRKRTPRILFDCIFQDPATKPRMSWPLLFNEHADTHTLAVLMQCIGWKFGVYTSAHTVAVSRSDRLLLTDRIESPPHPDPYVWQLIKAACERKAISVAILEADLFMASWLSLDYMLDRAAEAAGGDPGVTSSRI